MEDLSYNDDTNFIRRSVQKIYLSGAEKFLEYFLSLSLSLSPIIVAAMEEERVYFSFDIHGSSKAKSSRNNSDLRLEATITR